MVDNIERGVLFAIRKSLDFQRGHYDAVTSKTDLVDYNLDSLEKVDLISCLEDAFDIDVPDEDIDKIFKTKKGDYQTSDIVQEARVQDIIKYISEKLDED